jgi:hypothetical protein
MTARGRALPPGPEIAAVGRAQYSIPRRQDGFAAPTIDERAEQRLLAAAREAGYRLAIQCLDCRRWLVDPASVAAHRGPVCRARAGDAR